MSKSEKVKRKSGVGAFFGGTFFGFLLGIGAIVGICAFAYFKVSPQWLNNTFNTNIDLGNEEVNNKTLSDVVKTAINIGNNMDTYTLTDLKNDFGIDLGDKFKGIDITDLKTVPLSELGEKLQEKLTTISIAELEAELITLSGDIEQILGSSYTYYFYNGALYKDADHTDPVEDSDFKYTYNATDSNIEIKGNTFHINNEEVEIELRYLPLMTALGGFSNLKIADVMGFSYDGSVYYIDNNNNNTNDGGNETLSTILNTIAGVKIGDLPYKVSTLTLADVFSESERTGFLSLISNPDKVLLTGATQGEYLSINDAFVKAIDESTIAQLIAKGVIDEPEDYQSLKDDYTSVLKEDGTTYKKVFELTLPELIDYCFDLIDAAKQITG